MKQKLLLLSLLLNMLAITDVVSQCGNTGTFTSGFLTPLGVGMSTSATYLSGQYKLAYVNAGANYTVSTCGGSAYDTQLTIYDDASGAFLAYNDDYCGLQSTTSFTATRCGYVRIILHQYSCNASGLAMQVTCTMNTAGTPPPAVSSPAVDVYTCANIPVAIGDANPVAGGTTPYSYSWVPSTGLSSDSTATSIAAVSSSTSYTLAITDVNNCSVYDTVMVNINPLPIVNLGADTVHCFGTQLPLDAANPGFNFLWSDASTNQTLITDTAGTYSVTVTNPVTGCVSIDSINILVNPLPIVNLGTDTVFCLGGTLLLDAGNIGALYLWSDLSNAQALITNTTGTYSVEVTNPLTGCVNADTIGIVVNVLPVVDLGSDSLAQCDSVLLDAGNVGSTFLWNVSATSQLLTVDSSGIYHVTVTNAFGCTAVDSIVVTINPLPVVTLASFPSSICLQASAFTLTGGSPTGGTYSGIGVSGAVFSPTTSGVGSFPITYVFTDTLGCSNQAIQNITITDCTGMNDNELSNNLVVFPNPTNGIINIQLDNIDIKNIEISIVDLLGKTIYSSQEIVATNKFEKQMDVTKLAKGVYYIQVSISNKVTIQKLIVQ